ncbi:hypothetical protein GCM10023238_01430 [Streptomyces heliomycini]
MNARYKELLPQSPRPLSGMTGRLEGVENPAGALRGPAGPAGAGRGGTADDHTDRLVGPYGGGSRDPEEYAWAAGMTLQGRGDCGRGATTVARADDAVEHYLAPSPLQRQFDEQYARATRERAALRERLAARERLASMGDEERRAWLSAYFATRDECGPERGARTVTQRLPPVRPFRVSCRAPAWRSPGPPRPRSGRPEPDAYREPVRAGFRCRAVPRCPRGGDRHEHAQRVRRADRTEPYAPAAPRLSNSPR